MTEEERRKGGRARARNTSVPLCTTICTPRGEGVHAMFAIAHSKFRRRWAPPE